MKKRLFVALVCALVVYGVVQSYANCITNDNERHVARVGAAAWLCGLCGSYLYDPIIGCPKYGVAPGTSWESVPESFSCPICGASKDKFFKYYED